MPSPNITFRFRVTVEKTSEGFFAAYSPDIKGILVACETSDEIPAAFQESVLTYLAMSMKHGYPIPANIVHIEDSPASSPSTHGAPGRAAIMQKSQFTQEMTLNLAFT